MANLFFLSKKGYTMVFSCARRWRGYALCAVFEVFGSGWELTCVLKVNGKEGWSLPLLTTNVQPVSDHLWLFFVSRDLSCGKEWKSSCNHSNIYEVTNTVHHDDKRSYEHSNGEGDCETSSFDEDSHLTRFKKT
ncbi:hypothetical protein M0R45_009879 [Rubus argutus]|uniref:Uncharacterized protein n=1 Tax=Rubus argutus TaxID=59490 RepID=A0AAW1Y7Q3_RUBAR